MICFPNAKINIGLFVTGVRSDGYHNIASVFYAIPWRDALEVVSSDAVVFSTSGRTIPGSDENNLCCKAHHLIRREHPSLPPVHAHLRKHIAMGAGLGGGSADGAFMINLLNDFYELGLSVAQRESYAAELGSDCPFFIENTPKLVTGRGDKMTPHSLNLAGWWLAVVSPNIHISTQEAYSSIKPEPSTVDLNLLSADNVGQWTEWGVKNQFEAGIAARHPEIARIKEHMLARGAQYASMTGSGSSVYGLFREKPKGLSEDAQLFEL